VNITDPHFGFSTDTVLLIENDQTLRAALSRVLSGLGFEVRSATCAADARIKAADNSIDLVVLDAGPTDLDCSSSLRVIRSRTNVPIIVATSHRDKELISGLLNAGADDYMIKPFSGYQIAARIRDNLRRSSRLKPTSVARIGDLAIDRAARSVKLAGREIKVNRQEFDLLAYLAERPGVVVSRRALCENVWPDPDLTKSSTIDVYVSWLRRKLGETASNPRYLHTVRGVGLKLIVPT
jgi:DNA-binding response OmpR family regulator